MFEGICLTKSLGDGQKVQVRLQG